MWQTMQRHEAFVRGVLKKAAQGTRSADLVGLRILHDRQIRYMPHERLVHLVVAMFAAAFLLLSLGFACVRPSWGSAALALLLLILTSAYLNYHRLENGVQRWYHLANRISLMLGEVAYKYGDETDPRFRMQPREGGRATA